MSAAPTPDRPVVAPWTVLDSQISLADRWLRVRSDRVRTAEGDVFGPYHVIEYPDWVTVVALTLHSQQLVLVREYRHGVGRVLWGLPGGVVDREDGSERLLAAKVAAQRELLEETGFASGGFERLASVYPNPSNQSNTAYCFLATDVQSIAPQRPAGDGEAQDVFEADFVDVLADLRDGNATLHTVHVAALWAAAARIAADSSGRFGVLSRQLRRFLSGDGLSRVLAHASCVTAPVGD